VALESFYRRVNRVTFENEFVDRMVISGPEKLPEFFPPLNVIEQLQDKLSQKKIAAACEIPVAEYEPLPPELSVQEWKKRSARFKGDWVLKWARLGYDGYGTLLSSDRKGQEDHRVATFLETGRKKGVEIFIEKKMRFIREVALVAVRSDRGWMHYPLVVTEQEEGVCRKVYGPAVEWGGTKNLERDIAHAAKKMGDHLGYTGAYALECFDLGEGRWVLNEIAPRVHNSGHYTQNAMSFSQFENHIRAVMGMELGAAISMARVFGMKNLLGYEEQENSVVPLPGKTTSLHWYGKKEMKLRRKMGHINACAGSLDELRSQFLEMDQIERAWKNLAKGNQE
jgi:5-(carboxyamino)imidazole ribonucleotide synthase